MIYSPGVSELADAQLAYRRKVEQGLHRVVTDSHNLEECAEMMALYAEFAIDFTTMSMRHALLSAYTALDLQLSLEEKQREQEKTSPEQVVNAG